MYEEVSRRRVGKYLIKIREETEGGSDNIRRLGWNDMKRGVGVCLENI